LSDGGPEEGTTAAEGVGGEEKEGGAGYHFYDAVDAGGEEASLGAFDAEVLEDEGGVVVYCVAGGRLVKVGNGDGVKGTYVPVIC
jgi:protein tyrosine phosphatase (PTP) superfamily phosphohydrolase (DUF442 family)